MLFLILESSDVDPVPWCRRVGTESTEAGDLSFYRGALLASPSSSLSRDFVTREMSIGASQNYRELAWRKPKIPPSSSYRFLIPHWVVRRLHYRYGFNIQWSGPAILHDGYHITEVPGSLLPLDSSLPRSSSIPVFDVRFTNHHLKEILVVEFGVGCACPQAQFGGTILPQHWWINVRIESGFTSGDTSDVSRQTDQFVPQGPNEVVEVRPAHYPSYMLRDTGCSKRHLVVDPLLSRARQHIAFTHLHHTVHIESVLFVTDGRIHTTATFAPSPIVIMLDLESFDTVPGVDVHPQANHTTIPNRDALPQDPGDARVDEGPSRARSHAEYVRTFSSWMRHCVVPAMGRSTLREYWRSVTDWFGSEVDYTYGSLV